MDVANPSPPNFSQQLQRVQPKPYTLILTLPCLHEPRASESASSDPQPRLTRCGSAQQSPLRASRGPPRGFGASGRRGFGKSQLAKLTWQPEAMSKKGSKGSCASSGPTKRLEKDHCDFPDVPDKEMRQQMMA